MPLTRRISTSWLTTDRRNRLQVFRRFGSEGTWRLTKDHELALTLHADDARARQTLRLKGALIRAEANALVLALHRDAQDDGRSAQEVRLSGRWQADAANRLNFLVEKADGSADRLTFGGGWEVGPHHELRYRFRQPDGARRRREHLLAFDGAWDVSRADRLVYRLSGSTASRFEFSASLQSPSLMAKDGRIVYQVGVGLSGGRRQHRRVTLFGAWKLHRDLSVSFEVPYANGRVQAIRFEGLITRATRERVAVALRTSRRERLGLTVTFTKELVPDMEFFVRLRAEAEERSVVGGVQVRF